MPLTDAGALARHDLSERGKVAAERVRVLVVHGLGVDLAKMALTIFLGVHRVRRDRSGSTSVRADNDEVKTECLRHGSHCRQPLFPGLVRQREAARALAPPGPRGREAQGRHLLRPARHHDPA